MVIKDFRKLVLSLIITLLSSATFAMEYSTAEQTVLNLIWVNKSVEKTALICSGEEHLSEILNTVQEWREINPGAAVNFWYDGALIDENAIETMNVTIAPKLLDRITFLDIRSLEIVHNHPWAFSPKVNFYSRMDALRFAIAREYANGSSARRYFAYADVSAKSTSLAQLIEASQKDLDQDGIVMASAKGFMHELTAYELTFENGFMIIDTEKTDLMDAIEDILLAPFFKFTEAEGNLPFLSSEQFYKVLGTFLQIYCNRHLTISIADWNNKFETIKFGEKSWGVSLDVWTRNFYYAAGAVVSPEGVTEFPKAIPTITEQVLRASQFTRVEEKVFLGPKVYANFILQAPELDGIAFAKQFEREDMLFILAQSNLNQGQMQELWRRFSFKSY